MHRPTLSAFLGIILSAACGNGVLEPRETKPVELVFTFPDNSTLQQRVWLSTTVIQRGQPIEIRSVATNEGDGNIRVQIGCTPAPLLRGLEFDQRDTPVCQGIFGRELTPGDSIVREIITAPVSSSRGRHTLYVRHFIDPEFEAPIDVLVVR